MSRKNHAVQRIQKEMLELIKQPLAYVSAGPDDESDLTRWSATIAGPKGTPYEGGVFQLKISFPPEYPYKPPTAAFAPRSTTATWPRRGRFASTS